MKINAPKTGTFEFPGGKAAFALAGNVALGASAIQKCARGLQASTVKSPAEIFAETEKILDKEYRRSVFAHPNFQSDWTLAYSMLIAFWSRSGGEMALIATHETTLREVGTGYECIGIGESLGHYITELTYLPSLSARESMLRASYMLAMVKAHVPGCGGHSMFLQFGRDGKAEHFQPSPLDEHGSLGLAEIERIAKVYDLSARLLLFSAANPDVTDCDFNEQISTFVKMVRTFRQSWEESRKNRSAAREAIRRLNLPHTKPSSSSNDQT